MTVVIPHLCLFVFKKYVIVGIVDDIRTAKRKLHQELDVQHVHVLAMKYIVRERDETGCRIIDVSPGCVQL